MGRAMRLALALVRGGKFAATAGPRARAVLWRPLSTRLSLWTQGAADKMEPRAESCHGCGWQLQSDDPSALGYVPRCKVAAPPLGPEDLTPPAPLDGRHVVCARCWRIEHRNELVVPPPDQASKLATLKDRPGLVLLLVDLVDVEATLPVHFARLVAGRNPVLLVGNKWDLLPAGASDLRVRAWLKQEALRKSLNPCEVKLISARTGHGIHSVLDSVVERTAKFKEDVFVCGFTNAGKSTFVNKVIRMFQGPRKLMVTESGHHGTTLGFLPIPVGEHGRFIYDTPGLLGPQRAHAVLAPAQLAELQATAPISPVIYRLVPGKSLRLGPYARLDYVEGGGHLLFTLFASKALAAQTVATAVHKQSADGNAAQTPFEFAESHDHSWREAWTDISFSGVGWISITGRAVGSPIRLVAHTLAGVASPVARAPLMPMEAGVELIHAQNRVVHKHGKVRTQQ